MFIAGNPAAITCSDPPEDVGELEAEDDVCVQVGACSVQRTGKQLLGSRWTCPRRSAKFKPQKTFDFVDVDMCNLYLIICFSSITFSYLSVETDVRNVVSATSVKFDCQTKT